MNQQSVKPNQKRPNPLLVSDNVLETVRGLGSSVGKTLQRDVAGQIPNDMLRDLFDAGQPSGELRPDEALEVQPTEQKVRPTPKNILQPFADADKQQTQQSLSAVREQLKSIAAQTKNPEVQKAVIEQPVVDPGIYHKNFFEQLLANVRALGQNPEDGLTAFKIAGTRRKQMGYWGAFKKHGTSFGLSNERTVATQAG